MGEDDGAGRHRCIFDGVELMAGPGDPVPNGAHPARWWRPESGNRTHCYLCPRDCHIHDGQVGFCYIRVNRDGKLYNLGYGRPAAQQVDPIEKKPLNHFLPGTKIYSLGAAGCNMGCFFCQNWEISKARSDQVRSELLTPEDVVRRAKEFGCPSIAFTFNEPTIWGEYVGDVARLARAEGLNNVMVTNGYITREAFFDVYENIDAANVDLKGFTEGFYSKITLTHLEPVLQTLKWLRHETDVWFELTTLLIPGLNTDEDELKRLSEWVVENLGEDVPIHFTAFHPDFKLRDRPRTSPDILRRASEIARQAGVRYVYEGNVVSDGAHTRCPGCDAVLVERSWHSVLVNRIDRGNCPDCGTAIAGRWDQGRALPVSRESVSSTP